MYAGHENSGEWDKTSFTVPLSSTVTPVTRHDTSQHLSEELLLHSVHGGFKLINSESHANNSLPQQIYCRGVRRLNRASFILGFNQKTASWSRSQSDALYSAAGPISKMDDHFGVRTLDLSSHRSRSFFP